jgi:hypothetical protein
VHLPARSESSFCLRDRSRGDGAGGGISEFLASNKNGLLDENGDTSDWIELYNDGTSTVDLTGWTITDDAGTPGKWVFPAATVAVVGLQLTVNCLPAPRFPLIWANCSAREP